MSVVSACTHLAREHRLPTKQKENIFDVHFGGDFLRRRAGQSRGLAGRQHKSFSSGNSRQMAPVVAKEDVG